MTEKPCIKCFSPKLSERTANAAPYILDVGDDYMTHDGPDQDIFPAAMNTSWNGDNYGPLIVPSEGMTITINDSTLGLYGETIRLYEHHKNVIISGGTLTIDGQTFTGIHIRTRLLFYDGR